MALNYKINNVNKSVSPILTGTNDLALTVVPLDDNGTAYSTSNPYYGRSNKTASVKVSATNTSLGIADDILNLTLTAYDDGNGGHEYVAWDLESVSDSDLTAHTITLTGKSNSQTLKFVLSGDAFTAASAEVNEVSVAVASIVNTTYTPNGDPGTTGMYTFKLVVNVPINSESISRTFTVTANGPAKSDTVSVKQEFANKLRFVASTSGMASENDASEIVFTSDGYISLIKNGSTTVVSGTTGGVALDSNVSWTLSNNT